MSGSVFERYELKYLLSESQRRALEQQLGGGCVLIYMGKARCAASITIPRTSA